MFAFPLYRQIVTYTPRRLENTFLNRMYRNSITVSPKLYDLTASFWESNQEDIINVKIQEDTEVFNINEIKYNTGVEGKSEGTSTVTHSAKHSHGSEHIGVLIIGLSSLFPYALILGFQPDIDSDTPDLFLLILGSLVGILLSGWSLYMLHSTYKHISHRRNNSDSDRIL